MTHKDSKKQKKLIILSTPHPCDNYFRNLVLRDKEPIAVKLARVWPIEDIIND